MFESKRYAVYSKEMPAIAIVILLQKDAVTRFLEHTITYWQKNPPCAWRWNENVFVELEYSAPQPISTIETNLDYLAKMLRREFNGCF
jgi:hypothetical protein